MTFYAEDIESAREAISDTGEVVRWVETVPGVSDPDKPWETSMPTTLEYAPTIVFFPIKRVRQSSVGFAPGSDRVVGVARGLMANPGFVPTKTATVYRHDGTPYRILDWDVLSPDGSPILYTIEFQA